MKENESLYNWSRSHDQDDRHTHICKSNSSSEPEGENIEIWHEALITCSTNIA